jgi:hypothetical protein
MHSFKCRLETESLFFWSDLWLEGASLADIAPNLTAVVAKRRHKQRLVASALVNNT